MSPNKMAMLTLSVCCYGITCVSVARIAERKNLSHIFRQIGKSP